MAMQLAEKVSGKPEPIGGKVMKNLDSFTIEVERQENGSFVISSPDVRELQTEGETLVEALHNLTAACELLQAWYQQDRPLVAVK